MPVLNRNRAPSRNSSDDPEEFRATLGEHLEELRSRIIRSAGILLVAWVIGWWIEPFLYDRLENMAIATVRETLPPGAEIKLIFLHAVDAFMLKLRLSFILGLALALPFIVMELWGFVAPGLKPSERKPLKAVAPLTLVLFGLGVFFCWLVIPPAMRWFTGYLGDFPGAALHQEAGKLTTFAIKMMLAFGLAFQLPLVVFILGKIGLLTPETLFKYWRQSVAVIFFAAAVITPSNDPLSMAMMAVPLCLLFIISVYAVRLTTRKSIDEGDLDDLDP